MGPPGSGKGTQAELLSNKFNLYYFETSKIGEKRINESRKGEYIMVDGKKYFFEDEKKRWKAGKLWSFPFITALVQEEIKKLAEEDKEIVFAGSPRSIYEGKKVIPLLKKLYGVKNIKIVFIEVSPEQTIWRNSHRRICELMRHPILFAKETVKLKRCPLDGSKLVRRKGLDNPETIKVRLKEYKERTFPLINYFKEQCLKVKEINGEQSVQAVFEDILKSLKI